MTILTKQDLIESTEKHRFVFFWGHQNNKKSTIGKTCLSQWYPANFKLGGVAYNSAEHYMMAAKARLFHDHATLEKILQASDQGKIKALGRQVLGFEEETWRQEREHIVFEANLAKFSQNPELKRYLLSTENDILVEASPVDLVWGIGLSQDAEGVDQPTSWPGLNLLGFCLMRVRAQLRQDERPKQL